MLQQDPDHPLHALRLHGFACELQQVLQGFGGAGGLAEVDVQSRRLAGFGQAQLLGWSFFLRDLQGDNQPGLKRDSAETRFTEIPLCLQLPTVIRKTQMGSQALIT